MSSTPGEIIDMSLPIGAGTANAAPATCTAISQRQHSATLSVYSAQAAMGKVHQIGS